MKHLFSILLLLAGYAAAAQHNWLQGAGSNANDEALDIAHDVYGNVYSAGYFSQSARFDHTIIPSAGLSDVFIAKQDSAGTFLWIAKAGGTLDDKAFAVAVAPSGDIYVAGVYKGTATFGAYTFTSSGGSQDVFVAKLNSSGNFIWAKSFGGSDVDIATDIAVDPHNNVIVSGQFKGVAQFGSFAFTSVNYPLTMPVDGGTPSYDAFLFRMNAAGTVLWAKQGAAVYDDRILKLGVDDQSHIYACGQFSDTLHFANTYNNNAFNAGFVMRFDSTGAEQWFHRLVATQFMTYDMAVEGGAVWLTGDFSGMLDYVGTPSNYISGTYTHKTFVLKADAVTGNYMAGTSESSNNDLSSRSIAVDAHNNVFTSGYFRCSFTPFSLAHGSGLFYSVGYRDVYLVKYDASLHRQWEKQYGGIGDDYPAAMTVTNPDEPIIAGSYTKNFNVTDGGHFTSHVNNLATVNGNLGAVICGNSLYGQFITQKGFGNKDILLARPVDAACPLYDYFQRISGTCTLDTLMPVRTPSGDTLSGCSRVYASVQTPTTTDSLQAPEWSYHWSDGQSGKNVYFTTSGWKSVTYGYADNCRNFVDSFYVNVDMPPASPVINVYHAEVMDAIPFSPCLTKAVLHAGDTAMLAVSGIAPGNTFHWVLPGGLTETADTVYVSTPGAYSVEVLSPNGLCSSSNCVNLFTWDSTGGGGCSLGAFTPEIIFTNTTFNASDTVRVCKGDYFDVQLVDSTLFSLGQPTTLYTFATWTLSGGYGFSYYQSYPNTFGMHTQEFVADSSTNCSVAVDILDPLTGTVIRSISRNFYLDVHQPPPNVPVINGLTFFCPGDTVLLTASGGGNYVWNGPGIISQSGPANDSVKVNMAGNYTLTSVTTDPVLGCSLTRYAYFTAGSMLAPSVTMYPSHGVICPFDSVLLRAEPGGSYMWYGPAGTVIATTQSIYVTTPGIYYYTFISPTGCSLVSEMREVKQYTTPYIDAFPGTSLCANGTVLISALTDTSATLAWSSPLTGSAFTQTITSPGTYTVSASFCGITTIANITITNSAGTPVSLIYTGRDTICAQDTVVMMASGGYSNYTWYPSGNSAQSFTTTGGGTFYVQAQNQQGCLSSDSVTIFAYPPVAAPLVSDLAACAESSVSLVAAASGTVSWFMEPFGGIPFATGDSTRLNIGENDTVVYAAASNGTCYSGHVPLHAGIISGSQTPVITGNAVACAGDTLSLGIHAPVPGVNYTWNGPSMPPVTATALHLYPATALLAGTYSVYAESAACTSRADSITVAVNSIQLQPFASSSYTVCQYDSVQLHTDTLPGNYTWNTGFTGNSIYAGQYGDYYYTFTDAYGCHASSDTVHVDLSPAPSLLAMSDTLVCAGTPLSFTATADPSLNVSWYDEQDNLLLISLAYTLDSAVTENIIVHGVNANGCGSLWDTVHIAIQSPISSPLLNTDTTLCEGATLDLSAGSLSGYSYHWQGPGGFASSDVNPVISSLAAANSGTYTLYVVNGYCRSSTGSVTISLAPLPVVTASADTSICIGGSATLTAQSTGGSIIWNTGETTASITVSPVVSTAYSAMATNACATVAAPVHVTVNGLPNASAGPDMTELLGESTTLGASGGVSYSWSPSDGLSCTDCRDPQVTISAPQSYYVTVTDANSCVSGDSVFVNVLNVDAVYIPNAFSPNGDGINDEFRISGNNLQSCSILVYDRWGTKVFETSDLSAGWNGDYHGARSDAAVYVYRISVTLADGETRKFNGHLTLVR